MEPQGKARVADVMAALDALWPPELAEDWDSNGLVVGDRGDEVGTILVALDLMDATVAEAVARGADMIVTHHPLLMRGITSVGAQTLKGGIISALFRHGLAAANAHTNADSAIGGVSDILADMLGVRGARPLDEPDAAEPTAGIGRVGTLAEPLRLDDFAARVAEALPATEGGVRVAGNPARLIRRVAVCGGAGDTYFDAARASGADVYVTGDLRHHPATEALDTGNRGPGEPMALIDVSHWASESVWVAPAAAQLEATLHAAGFATEVVASGVTTDPWTFVLPSR